MNFLIYDIYDGKIVITGSGKNYKNLRLESYTEVITTKNNINPLKQYVNVSTRKVISRPVLDLNWNKTTIKNDGKDTASCELDYGFDVKVLIPNVFKSEFDSDGDKLEINSLVESDVIVTIDQFPYQKYTQIIEVISNE